MKKYFLTGLAIFLPIILTIMIGIYLIDLFTTPFLGLAQHLLVLLENQENLPLIESPGWLIFVSRIVSSAFVFLLILLLGFLGRKLFFRTLLQKTHTLFLRIPIIKSIYQITKEISKAAFEEDKKIFQETILITFPSEGTKALGFLIQEVPSVLKKISPNLDVGVFIPTAPHPISGFLLFTNRKEIESVPISVEDTFKFLISCGTIDLAQTSPAAHEHKL